MKLEEAIKICNETIKKMDGYECQKDLEDLMRFLQELEQYRKIGTISRCKYSVEKQTPIEAAYEGDSIDEDGNYIYDTWICPTCRTRYEIDVDDYNYCPNCGQRVSGKKVTE